MPRVKPCTRRPNSAICTAVGLTEASRSAGFGQRGKTAKGLLIRGLSQWLNTIAQQRSTNVGYLVQGLLLSCQIFLFSLAGLNERNY